MPKSTYVSFSKHPLDVFDAVASFNIGREASIAIFEEHINKISVLNELDFH